MRKLFSLMMLFGSLWAAADVWSQERGEPVETRELREPGARMGGPQRGDSMRATPPVVYRTRPGHFMEDPAGNTRQFEDVQRQQLQRSLPQDQARDPRNFSYRTRPMPSEAGGAYVSREMQRAIERAQSEHGGKVLSADRIRFRGQDTYRVKLLTPSGRVRVVQLTEQAAPDAAATEDQRKGDD